jgi:hypothetical protein
VRAAATIAAATYMLIYVVMILALPLFPAQPKLAPIYHSVDHMVPPAFPLLLVVPAAAIDLLEWLFTRRAKETTRRQATMEVAVVRPKWWRDWLIALVVALLFVASVYAVQWRFSAFLISDGADNRFFARSGHWPYFAQPGDWMNRFWDLRKDPVTITAMAWAVGYAFVTTRLGLWLGNYLLRLKR